MINIDFYRETALLFKETNVKRIEHFIELNKQMCEYYHIENQGEFDTKSMKDENGVQTDIGTFDVFSKTMFLEETYVNKSNLSQEQLFEIVESLLHEPKHLKQLLEYEKDSSKYPGIYASMPSGLGYHSQKEEDEAYTETFKEMQEIIDYHKNTTGNEKQFYDNMQKYLDKRIKEHEFQKRTDVENIEKLSIKLGNFFTSNKKKEENLFNILPIIKKGLEPNIFLKESYKKSLPTCTNYEILNFNEAKATIFEHDKIWYCDLKSKNLIDIHQIIFEIKNDDLNISIFLGIKNNKKDYDLESCKKLYKNLLEIKDFYEKENNVKLKINFAKYQIDNDNLKYQNLIKNLNCINLDLDNISQEFEFARIKTALKDFILFNKKDLDEFINITTKSNILKDEDKQFLNSLNVNDEIVTNCFKLYITKIISSSTHDTNPIDNFSIKNFKEFFNVNCIKPQLEKIKNSKNFDLIDDEIKKFKEVNKINDYITKRNVEINNDIR